MLWIKMTVAFAATCLVCSGCAGVTSRPETDTPLVVADGYEYLDGILRRDYQAPIHEVWDATLKAISALRVQTETRRKGEHKGIIRGTTHDGNRLTIEVIQKSSGLTKVEVQIGWIGDRLKSQFVHDAIADKLGRHGRQLRPAA